MLMQHRLHLSCCTSLYIDVNGVLAEFPTFWCHDCPEKVWIEIVSLSLLLLLLIFCLFRLLCACSTLSLLTSNKPQLSAYQKRRLSPLCGLCLFSVSVHSWLISKRVNKANIPSTIHLFCVQSVKNITKDSANGFSHQFSTLVTQSNTTSHVPVQVDLLLWSVMSCR